VVALGFRRDYHFFIWKLPDDVGTIYIAGAYAWGNQVPQLFKQFRLLRHKEKIDMNTILSHMQRETASEGLVRLPFLLHGLVRVRTVMVMLAVCMALQMTGFVLILPLFARRLGDFGAGVEVLGMSAMAYALTSTLSAPFMGALADRFGRRPIILIALVAYVLAFSGYLLVTSAWAFILLRGLAGVFTAGLVPAMTGIVSDLAPANRRAQWIGIMSGGASAGWIIGPVLGGLLYDNYGYVLPFAISIAFAAGTLLVAIFLVPETQSQPQQANLPEKSRGNWMSSIRVLQASLPKSVIAFLVLMLISFGVMFAWAFIEPQFMFYAYDNLKWSSSQLGLVMSTYGVAMMIGEFVLSPLSDRFGRKPVLVLGLALFSAQFIGLALFRDVTWIVASFLLAGLGNALFDPALSAHILDITPPEHKARIMGIKGTVGSLGNMLGPALVVLFTPFMNAQGVFLIATFLVILLTITSGLTLKVREK
jgi:DHA1 family tetracycline resistance protein-like MFS transporter